MGQKRLPWVIPKLPYGHSEFQQAFKEQVEDKILVAWVETTGFFLNCIEDESYYTREELEEAVVARDEYIKCRQAYASINMGKVPK